LYNDPFALLNLQTDKMASAKEDRRSRFPITLVGYSSGSTQRQTENANQKVVKTMPTTPGKDQLFLRRFVQFAYGDCYTEFAV